ncbi:MAG: amphi-Trp domain-containing protein [Desulfobulbaceae bacterium]|nr:MAG: amphi-Trp domain-containing protein [Desulfobulbaceae bacterium]
MGRETVLFKSEGKKSRSDIAALLRQAADKIEEGRLTLQQGESEISLLIPETAIFEMKVEEESKRQVKRSLEFEIEWLEGEEQGGGNLSIS